MIYNDLIGATGRLGNQLWELASTLGIADKNLEPAEFIAWEYQEFFNVRPEWFLPKGEHPTGTSVYDTPDVQHLAPAARPYLQDYSFFAHIASSIREWLRPSPFAEQVLSDMDGEYWELPRPKVALHIRRGDNATAHERNEQGNHPLRPMSYYAEALNELTPESIAVFSDDIAWCRENATAVALNAPDRIPIAYFEGGPARARECEDRYRDEEVLDWIDLLAMTDCDQFILSNSTYSWWAAFLSGVEGSQIRYPHPRVWFGRKLRNIIDASLMFPGDWVPIMHEDH